MEKTIKLSEIKKLDIKPGECLVMLDKKKDDQYEMAQQLGEMLQITVLMVDNFDDLRVISISKLKK